MFVFFSFQKRKIPKQKVILLLINTTAMSYINYRIEGHTGILEFNRPEKHHAFNKTFLEELSALLEREKANPDLHILILTGGGEKAFSSGVDLSALLDLKTVEAAREFALLLESTSEKIFRFPKPTIAFINGFALGGGLGFATAADIRIMSTTAKVGYPAVKLGAILPVTCTLYLNSLVGEAKAKDLLLTGKIVDANQAFKLGLVQYTAEPEEGMPMALRIAGQIAEGGQTALHMTKQTVNFTLYKEIESAKIYAADNFAYLSQTAEWQKRIRAFAEKK